MRWLADINSIILGYQIMWFDKTWVPGDYKKVN